MTRRSLIGAVMMFGCALFAGKACGQLTAPYFFDDFADGSAIDGNPVTWAPYAWIPDDASVTVEDESLIIIPPEGPPELPGYDTSLTEIDVAAGDLFFTDVSIRTVARAVDPGPYALGIVARDTVNEDGLTGRNIWAGLGTNGELGFGPCFGNGTTANNQCSWYGQAQTDLRPEDEDVHLKWDIFGDRMSLTAWADGQEMPKTPQLSTTLPQELLGSGKFAMWSLGSVGVEGRRVAFRYIAALPEAYIAGDFNDDGVLTTADIDRLTAEVRSTRDWHEYDLNADDRVDSLDRDVWVQDLKHTWFGDANLDGSFGTSDLVDVLQAGEYEDAVSSNSTWSTGDWDGDGEFTSVDLVVALADGGYELGPRPVAVPEPCGTLLRVPGLLALYIRRRRSETTAIHLCLPLLNLPK